MERLLLIQIILFSFPCIGQPADCELKREKDGIKVFTCKSDSGELRSIQAEFVIENISIEELKAFMFSVSDYPEWQYEVIEATILKKISPDEMIFRVVADAPWPLENRELIARFSTAICDAEHANFYTSSIPFDFPQNEDLVRVPYSYARWDVVRIDNSLHVTYKMHVNPGGYVPAFLVNMAIAEGPYKSFKKLKYLIEGKK